MKSVDSNSGRVFFLDTPGGTKKKVFVEFVTCYRKNTQQIAIFVASSGIL